MQYVYQTLANGLVLIHLAYVSFVVLGFLAILVGLALGKPWARSPLLRISHLVAILIVAAESLLGITCPLTTWEKSLRHLAGQETVEGDFVATLVHRVMFFEFEPWVFTTAYVTFGLLVLATFLVAPPRFRRTEHAGRAPQT